MRTRSRSASLDAEWERVWAEHDARQGQAATAVAVPTAAALPARPDPAAPSHPRGGGRWALAALLLLLPMLWTAEPIVTAWQVARALEGGDVRALGRHVDVHAVEAGIRTRLSEVAGRVPDGPAGEYLRQVADDIALAWADPVAIASVARPSGQAPRLASVGVTGFEMVVGAAVAPMTLRFELSEGALMPRWQVTDVRMETPMPQHAPPPTRFSSR